MQFNNCSTPPEDQQQLEEPSIACDSDCITPTDANLEVLPHLGGNGTIYSVPYDLIEFNMGGDCNEGGYAYNIVRWELHSPTLGKVRDSSPAYANSDSHCVNGRYMIYVRLKAITGDNIDRSGLKTNTGARGPYDLYIEVIGMDSPSDPMPKRNFIRGRKRISLVPI